MRRISIGAGRGNAPGVAATAYKKGTSGNPAGRPKGIAQFSWKNMLAEVGQQVDPKSGKLFCEAVSYKLWEISASGNISAMTLLMNRMEGLPAQAVDLTSKGESINFNMDAVIG